MDRAAIKVEVGAAFDRYLTAFLQGDMPTINAVVSYPLAYIGATDVQLFDKFPIDPGQLVQAKGWHATVNMQHEVVAVSPSKAHVVLRTADRVRKDGSLIETASGFYAFKHTAQGWRMFALSDVVNPALRSQ